ncbi:hypothetical protein BCV53_12035 [Parageobacillus thermoglucosidasius]|uniref:Uncharacterized protein n=1 Tax=Parageobacillus thermoglucosidasius TaxID=1426 RepID=A0AAN0YQQ2_PARTM|nr:hypothetical protein AOT13_12025 [Parageobacillus thermoglucosidasius]ANZ30761.1 hypothetical protein BCV53_12035 [Parageobacillus thermoglucosidasius]APM81498.1 hypothetical protein BCV54_12045 [Parageobacillus thermoglucosidasius]KJX69332.1 hypothetical protein WH82_07600 [Parageobacillus thermoglucosidasius]RDE22091.1 hypothetical protein DV712_18750 [Parageobacillus thermoglucosidasius]
MFPKKDSCPEMKKEMRIRTFFVFVNKYIVLSWAATSSKERKRMLMLHCKNVKRVSSDGMPACDMPQKKSATKPVALFLFMLWKVP